MTRTFEYLTWNTGHRDIESIVYFYDTRAFDKFLGLASKTFDLQPPKTSLKLVNNLGKQLVLFAKKDRWNTKYHYHVKNFNEAHDGQFRVIFYL